MISRRVFLRDGAYALVSLGFAPSFLARTALAAADTARRTRLIAIFQRGAVDGLSYLKSQDFTSASSASSVV